MSPEVTEAWSGGIADEIRKLRVPAALYRSDLFQCVTSKAGIAACLIGSNGLLKSLRDRSVFGGSELGI